MPRARIASPVGTAAGAMIPIHYGTDREVLDAALPLIGLTDPPDARLLWIRNTPRGRGNRVLGGLLGRGTGTQRSGGAGRAPLPASRRGRAIARVRRGGRRRAELGDVNLAGEPLLFRLVAEQLLEPPPVFLRVFTALPNHRFPIRPA